MYQCAEITRIAFGLGSADPMAAHCCVYAFSSSAFIGLPCPKNSAGIRGGIRWVIGTFSANNNYQCDRWNQYIVSDAKVQLFAARQPAFSGTPDPSPPGIPYAGVQPSGNSGTYLITT